MGPKIVIAQWTSGEVAVLGWAQTGCGAAGGRGVSNQVELLNWDSRFASVQGELLGLL